MIICQLTDKLSLERWVGKKSMCVAAKGRLQGRAATLLLLWVGFPFSFLSLCSKFTNVVVSFFQLAPNSLICIQKLYLSNTRLSYMYSFWYTIFRKVVIFLQRIKWRLNIL